MSIAVKQRRRKCLKSRQIKNSLPVHVGSCSHACALVRLTAAVQDRGAWLKRKLLWRFLLARSLRAHLGSQEEAASTLNKLKSRSDNHHSCHQKYQKLQRIAGITCEQNSARSCFLFEVDFKTLQHGFCCLKRRSIQERWTWEL